MGSTKRIQYDQRCLDIANMYKALGHPARTRIVELLLEHGKLNASSLGKELNLAPATITHHLDQLYLNGIIGKEHKGKDSLCCVQPDSLDFLESHINTINFKSKNQPNQFDKTYFLPTYRLDLTDPKLYQQLNELYQ